MSFWRGVGEFVGVLAKRTLPAGEPGEPRIIMVPRTVAGVRVDHDTALKSSVVWSCAAVIGRLNL